MTDAVIVTQTRAGAADGALAIVKALPDGADVVVLSRDPDTVPGGVRTVDPAAFSPSAPVADALTNDEALAVALPGLLASLLEEFRQVIWLAPGVLPISIPDSLRGAVTLARQASVVAAHVRNPDLPDADRPRDPAVRTELVALGPGSDAFLSDWQAVVGQALVDVDQRPVGAINDDFLRRAVGRRDVVVDGDGLLMSWVDYAAMESGRAEGPNPSFLLAHELFAVERERRKDPDESLEVEWQMLAHKVHDSRPLEPLIEAIRAGTEGADVLESDEERLLRDVRRAIDPAGLRWEPTTAGREAFLDWAYAETEGGLTRLAHAIGVSPVFRERFPNVKRNPQPFLAWLDESWRELGFSPSVRGGPTVRPQQKENSKPSSVLPEPLRWRFVKAKALLPGAKERDRRREEEFLIGPDPGLKRGVAAPRRSASFEPTAAWDQPRGLNVVGCFRSESGLGQAARASLTAVRDLSLPFSYVDTSEKYPSRNSVDVGLDREVEGAFGDVNLIHSNADEMLTLAGGVFRHRFAGKFNAAMWFWETADLPARSRPAFDLVDELWVASEYLVDVFGQYGKVPVHNIGLAADLPQRREPDREPLGWRDDFVYLFVYDALSSFGRKNPLGAMKAFLDAFPDQKGLRFVLKVSNLNKFPASQEEILGLAATDDRIQVIDEYLLRDEVMNLMASADVYVSLHAAEGFGLTLMEAMALGTPVVCTAYSGNMDFTDEGNSWLVDYDMVRSSDQTGPYPEGSVWARPKHDAAVEALRAAYDDRSALAVKAALAEEAARAAASPELYAQRLAERLDAVM